MLWVTPVTFFVRNNPSYNRFFQLFFKFVTFKFDTIGKSKGSEWISDTKTDSGWRNSWTGNIHCPKYEASEGITISKKYGELP